MKHNIHYRTYKNDKIKTHTKWYKRISVCGPVNHGMVGSMKCSSCLQRIDLASLPCSESCCPHCGTGIDKVRAAVFLVIVRKALAGEPWKETCAAPMRTNNITPEEIMAELDNQPPPNGPAAASAGIPSSPVFKDYSGKNKKDS
jgi:hypothetical protein